MELTTVYIWGSLGAAFCLFVGALIGHAIYDRQQMVANVVQREHLSAVDEKWRHMLEAAYSESVTNEEKWQACLKYRKVLEDASTAHGLPVYEPSGHSPMVMLTNLCIHVAKCAIDPKQNQKAKNLYVKGVRAGAKKGREQMQKLMQKSIDNQAATIDRLSAGYDAQVAGRQSMMETLTLSHKREDIYRAAVANTLTDKVGLVSVRRAIVQGIAAECSRLRAVEAKKGE